MDRRHSGTKGWQVTRNRPVRKVSAEDTAFVRGLVIYEDDKVIVFDGASHDRQ